jgi:hypothetical protein
VDRSAVTTVTLEDPFSLKCAEQLRYGRMAHSHFVSRLSQAGRFPGSAYFTFQITKKFLLFWG